VYRVQTVVPKSDDTFVGELGTVLSGAVLATSFSRTTIDGVTYWTVAGPKKRVATHPSCDRRYPLCGYSEDLYIDNRPLERVGTLGEVRSGTCFLDYSKALIYFADDPAGRSVEISTSAVAFNGSAHNVRIQGLVIEKYATAAQIGAVGGEGVGVGWVLQNSEVRLNHGTGVKLGDSAQVISNSIHDNGQLGIFGRSAAVIEDNEVAYNNWAGFSMNWEAGGVKLGNATGVVLRGNRIHDNVGMGLWSDGACTGGIYENNIIYNNAFHGILHEVSHAWTMRNNAIFGNGFGTAWGEWLGGAGIEIDESDHVEVHDNFVAKNYKGIALNMSVRSEVQGADLNNDFIHDNTIVQVSGVSAALYQRVGNRMYYTAKNNRFLNNRYCLGDPKEAGAFWWNDGSRSYAQWMAGGGEAGGVLFCPAVFVTKLENSAIGHGQVTLVAFGSDISPVRTLDLEIDGKPISASTAASFTDPRHGADFGTGVASRWDTVELSTGTHIAQVTASSATGRSAKASIHLVVGNE
jgi:parallel beta-helix repeat protein